MNLRTSTALARMAAQPFPAADALGDTERSDRALQLLSQLNRGTPPLDVAPGRTAVLTRRRVLLVAGIGAVVALGSATVYPGLTSPTAYAATPPMLQYAPVDAKETPTNVLDGLADLARRQPPPAGSGPFAYIHTQGWYLYTSQMTDGRTLDSRIEVSDRELWLAPNGAGRIEETRAGQRTSVSARYEPGGLAPWTAPAGPVAGLQDRLVDQNPGRNPADWVSAVKDIWNNQAVSPALQGALLNILATQPGLHLDGTVTDRAGRRGIVVSADGAAPGNGPRTRRVLILNPDTGMLLGFEEIALEAGGLPIKAPATIGYTLWLSSGHTNNTDTRP